MPAHPSFIPEFLDMYRVARMWQADSLIEKIIEISKSSNLPPEEKKIQIDALKIAASKLDARKHGDEKPRQISIKVVYISPESDSPNPK